MHEALLTNLNMALFSVVVVELYGNLVIVLGRERVNLENLQAANWCFYISYFLAVWLENAIKYLNQSKDDPFVERVAMATTTKFMKFS